VAVFLKKVLFNYTLRTAGHQRDIKPTVDAAHWCFHCDAVSWQANRMSDNEWPSSLTFIWKRPASVTSPLTWLRRLTSAEVARAHAHQRPSSITVSLSTPMNQRLLRKPSSASDRAWNNRDHDAGRCDGNSDIPVCSRPKHACARGPI